LKRGDAQSLTQIPCPLCKSGKAVNRHDAYLVFTSKKYVKLRKAHQRNAEQSLPTVGKNTNLEAVLLDPAAAEFLHPMAQFHKMTWVDGLLHYLWLLIIFRVLLVAFSIWVMIWLLETGWAEDARGQILQGGLFVILVTIWCIWFWIERQVKVQEAAEVQTIVHDDRIRWVCLQCQNQFLWDGETNIRNK
jgi:hypothetical protein